MTDWKTIDTAPQDGEDILTWWKHAGVRVCFWNKEGDMNMRAGWRSEADNCTPINQEDCTHWMPLPSGPSH
jgi:hypothetical protein